MAESAARIEAVTRLQQRWGAGIIRRGVEVGDAGLRVAPVRGTGVAALDALLGRRGLPDGITLLRGGFGAGRTTLALRALAATQAAGGAAAWIDAARALICALVAYQLRRWHAHPCALLANTERRCWWC